MTSCVRQDDGTFLATLSRHYYDGDNPSTQLVITDYAEHTLQIRGASVTYKVMAPPNEPTCQNLGSLSTY